MYVAMAPRQIQASGIGLTALALLFLAPLRVTAAPVFDFTGGDDFFSAGDFALGWAFRTTVPLSIDGLGFWDEGGNGLGDSHQIRLWNGNGSSLLASTTITNASTPVPSASPDGRWLFNNIAPIILPIGDYVLGASFSGGDADHVREGGITPIVLSAIPGVTFVEPRSATGGASFPNMPQPGVVRGYFSRSAS